MRVTLVAAVLSAWFTLALAAATPEDLLKGQLLASDQAFPTKWSNPEEYAARLKKHHKPALAYDANGKLTVEYAAFFASQVNDPVSFVAYDVADGIARKVKKASYETPLGKGSRALFGKVSLNKSDLPANRKYRFAIETAAGKPLAYNDVALR